MIQMLQCHEVVKWTEFRIEGTTADERGLFHEKLAHARYAFGIGRKQSYALLQGACGTLMLQFFFWEG
jgi:hypothetical protein